MTETKKPTKIVVLDVGKQKKRVVKSLRSGIGEIIDEAVAAVDETAPPGKTIQPVVILFEKRRKDKSGGLIKRLAKRL